MSRLINLPLCVAALMALAFAVTSGLAQAGRTVNLAPLHDASREFRFRVQSETRQSSSSPVLSPFEAKQDLTFKVKVKEADDAGYVIELTHEHMKIDIKSDTLTASWDSDQDERLDADNRIGRIARPLIGKPVTLQLDRTGEIRRIAGLEALAPGGLDGALFRQLFSEDSFTSMYHMIFRIKEPPAEASRGMQWRLLDKGGQGLVRVSREYHLTLERAQGEIAHIRIKGVASEEGDGGMPGMTAEKYELEGWCDWNTELGVMQELETSEHAIFKAAAGEADLSLESTSRTTLKRLR